MDWVPGEARQTGERGFGGRRLTGFSSSPASEAGKVAWPSFGNTSILGMPMKALSGITNATWRH
ncbi:hypothetical protein CPC08DRAFT_715484 [Agrocybe pediades]|nr:hypothetical protein CPC08DRAFT_715484 [Agrocybe pediades]